VAGIDLDPTAVQWAKEKEGIEDIRCGVLVDVLQNGEQFDAITMFDYLEHTDRPGDDLDHLITHLKPGGVLIIRAPNTGGWQARMMGSRWIAIMPTHLSYFSKSVLADALTSRGLEIHYMSARNYRTELDILKQRLGWAWKRLHSSPPSAHSDPESVVSSNFGRLKLALWRWSFSIMIEQVDHLAGWFNAGNNLTAIARKHL
jgi:SAM-dependent methyltransferase